ncbi:hypothetical protein [Synechococcus phage S-N03]|uniref:Uncharacterized protein n=1 Tax=Synechococcus phage S-N03 TaxID=2718943 RepID=A0A6G8R6U5_9CAUD|nr:hypothetical protein PQC09_gp189 [Synechococcus phage S-N03]QIN96878.1 hypothetical protein [Synechococcus phage S-N03]
MAIDMPNSPTTGQIYLAPNGINYEWDGAKWVTYVDPSLTGNVWGRDNASTSLYPVNDGDSVVVKNTGGTTTITLDENGTITALEYNIDSLPALP